MTIWGSAWRYQGSTGISRGYLVVRHGALNSDCTGHGGWGGGQCVGGKQWGRSGVAQGRLCKATVDHSPPLHPARCPNPSAPPPPTLVFLPMMPPTTVSGKVTSAQMTMMMTMVPKGSAAVVPYAQATVLR